MNIIYLDTLFLVNFICDYILLLCTARVGGAVIRRVPILFSAGLGGLYACLCCLPHFPWLSHPLLKCVCSVLLCLISFGSDRHLFRCALIFICVSAMVGGLLSAVSIPYEGAHYIPIQAKTTICCFVILYCTLHLFFRNFSHSSRKDYQQVTVSLNGKTASFRALHDSGNELYDPITNRPVLVCSPKVLYPLFPNDLNRISDPYELFIRMSSMEEYKNRVRLIPCRTVTGNGILTGFKADCVMINGEKEDHIIALSAENFSLEAPYQAIF